MVTVTQIKDSISCNNCYECSCAIGSAKCIAKDTTIISETAFQLYNALKDVLTCGSDFHVYMDEARKLIKSME